MPDTDDLVIPNTFFANPVHARGQSSQEKYTDNDDMLGVIRLVCLRADVDGAIILLATNLVATIAWTAHKISTMNRAERLTNPAQRGLGLPLHQRRKFL